MGSRPLGLFLFYFLHTLFLFFSLLWCFGFFLWFCIFLFGRFFSGLSWAFVGYFLDLRGFVLFVSYFSDGHDLGFHFFSFVGGSGVLSHRAYLGTFLFFVGSLLQRRKTLSDFVGLTSPRGGKGPYFSILTLRPGLLLCSDLSFFCNHGIQQHTHTHTHTYLFPRAVPFLSLGSWPTFWLIALPLLHRFE